MITPQVLIQLKAFARQDGALLSLLWIASFAGMMYMPQSAVGNLLALATPIVVGWRLCKFRDDALDGVISLRRGYAYAFYVFFYASLVFALAQYLYFAFLDGGRFSTMLSDALRVVTPIYEQQGMSKAEIDQGMGLVMSLGPLHWTFVFMVQNILVGLVLGLPIGAVCRKRS